MIRLFKNIGTGLAKFFNALSGRLRKGMKLRFVIAVALAVTAILVDSYMVYTNYDYLPSYVGTYYNWDYVATVIKPKSVFWNYEMERIAILLIFVGIGLVVYSRNKASLIRFRSLTFLAETANLIIMTGVGVSIIMLAISTGDTSQQVSDNVEFIVMIVWFAILLVEYIFDIRFLKQNATVTEPVENK